MALPPPECDERGGFYPVLKAMELPAEFGYTTSAGKYTGEDALGAQYARRAV
jgi:hypothetical protein